MTQQSDPSRLSGPAHTSQTLSQSGLSPQCGGTAHESIPGGYHCFREALLHTSSLNGNHSCSCARADGGLQLHAGVTLVFLCQLRCDGIWFTVEFYFTCARITESDCVFRVIWTKQKKGFSYPFVSGAERFGKGCCWFPSHLWCEFTEPAMSSWHVSPLCVPRLSSPLFSISLQCRCTKDSWLSGEIQTGISDGLAKCIWLLLFSGISSVLKHCWNPRRGKCERRNSCNDAFHCCV